MTAPPPPEFNPDLTAERLSMIGQLVADAHDSAVADEDLESGDGPWSTGCRSYQRVMVRLEELSRHTPWLTFRREGALVFYVLVGQCPMRVRKDDQQRAASQSEIAAATQTDMFGVADTATMRIEKIIVDRRCMSVDLLATSTDDTVVYHRWEIFRREDGIVIDTPPGEPYDPRDPDLSPNKGRQTSDDVDSSD